MPRKKDRPPENEWSSFVDIDEVPAKGLNISLQAPDDVKEALARRLAIQSLEDVQAQLRITKEAGEVFHVSGHFRAEITQACVVTTEPVHSILEESVEGWFIDKDANVMSFAKARQEQETGKGHAEVEILAESDDPEPVIGGQIDAGELVVQHLSLAINPYIHKKGAEHDFTEDTAAHQNFSESRKSPFEALKDWKEKR